MGLLLEYPEAIALLYSGLNSRSEMKAEISCEKGNIYLMPRWHEADSYEWDVEGEGRMVDLPTKGKGYTHEIEEVHRCLREGFLESPHWSWEDSKALHRLLQQVRAQCGIRFPGEES